MPCWPSRCWPRPSRPSRLRRSPRTSRGSSRRSAKSCHRPDSIAPMSLVTYEEARPWARSIKNRVAARQMPPWHIDKTVGIQDFQNDRSLSDEQIDTIVRWVDAGAPKGDPKDMPPPVKWADDNVWNFAPIFGGPPDLDRQVAGLHAEGAWRRTPGTSRSVATGLTEARWVRAIEIRPGTVKGRKITHHALARLQQTENGEPGVRQASAPGDRRRSGSRPLHGMGRRQAGRNHAPELRQADAARLEDRVGHPLLTRSAKTSPTTSSSASTSIRRARSRSSARRWRSSAASPAATATSTSRRTRSTSARTST